MGLFFFSSLQQTNVQPLAPILASERMSREERGQGICSFPWPEPNVGPPWLPLSLSPSPYFSWQWKNAQNRAGVGERGEEGGKVDGERRREKALGGGGLLDQEEEREHLC